MKFKMNAMTNIKNNGNPNNVGSAMGAFIFILFICSYTYE
jgi:hypothetical protein